MPERVMIGLGSNLGDRLASLNAAACSIGSIKDLEVTGIARVYESPALVQPGAPPQPPYLNTVIAAETMVQPEALLHRLLKIEIDLGRVHDSTRWQPRPIDLDILAYGERVIDSPALRVPHPEMTRRAFVLLPLAELAPDFVIPGETETVGSLASRFGAATAVPVASINPRFPNYVDG